MVWPGLQRGGAASIPPGRRRRPWRCRDDAARQAGQHLAGADLLKRASRRWRSSHSNRPGVRHTSGDLRDQRPRPPRRSIEGAAATLVTTGTAGRLRRWRAPSAPRRPPWHQRRMKRCRNRQQGRACGALSAQPGGVLDRRPAPRSPVRRCHCRWQSGCEPPGRFSAGRFHVGLVEPMIVAMAPAPTGAASCMALPRMRNSRAASATEEGAGGGVR